MFKRNTDRPVYLSTQYATLIGLVFITSLVLGFYGVDTLFIVILSIFFVFTLWTYISNNTSKNNSDIDSTIKVVRDLITEANKSFKNNDYEEAKIELEMSKKECESVLEKVEEESENRSSIENILQETDQCIQSCELKIIEERLSEAHNTLDNGEFSDAEEMYEDIREEIDDLSFDHPDVIE